MSFIACVEQVIFERRILLGCTVLVGLSVCIWSVAIGTDYWFTIEAPDKNGLPIGDPAKGRRLIYKNMGLWRGCVQGIVPESENSTKLVPFGKSFQENKFSHFFLPLIFPAILTFSRAKYSKNQVSRVTKKHLFLFLNYSFVKEVYQNFVK